MSLIIRPITAAQTRPLRHQILRPHLPFETTLYPQDEASDTFHAGALENDQVVGVATVFRAPMPMEPWPLRPDTIWQLRGMAVRPAYQGQGLGQALVKACLEHLAHYRGEILWCNGRTSALHFYQALGFQTLGDEFESVNGTGPHYVMWRQVLTDK